MLRLANGTQASALPSPPAAVGTPGFASPGDAAAGIQASVWDAYTFNRMQEELMAFLTAAGIAPDPANNAQVLAAIRALYPQRIVVYGASGPLGVPAGIRRLKIRGWGAGGGGGGTSGAGSVGAGGGSGGYFEGYVDVTPGQIIQVTVGAGGTRGSNAGGGGGTGGTTSFGSYASATGGFGGYGAGPNSIAPIAGTAGGIYVSPGVSVFGDQGQGGGTGFQTGSGGLVSGGGGNAHSYASAGVSNSNSSTPQPGNDGMHPGVGGGGGISGGNGGIGGAGRVIVEW